MSVTPPTRPMREVYAEARRLANAGYGWEDLVVRLPIGQTTAKMMVMAAAYRKLARERRQPE